MKPADAEQITQQYRETIRARAVELRNNYAEEHHSWTLEAVRHLAFVNAAGLAGTAALYASRDIAKKVVGPFGSSVALLFAIGLAMAVLDMFLISLGTLARLRELDYRLRAWDRHPSPGQEEADLLLRDVEAGRWFFRFAGYAGWASAIVFATGAYPFVFLRF